MRNHRTLGLFLAVLAAASSARADDNKPPNISDVKVAVKGSNVTIEAKITDDTGVLNAACFHRKGNGKWEESQMVKNEYDDVFKVSFPGGGDTDYYLSTTDILGNGPATYGSQAKPMPVGAKSKKPEAETPPPPPPPEPVAKAEKPKREPRPAPEPKPKASKPAMVPKPVIVHRKPSISPLEGQEFTLRVKISAEGGVATAAAYVRPQGSDKTLTIPLVAKGDEQYIAVIPATYAKGTIEYLLAAKDGKSQQTNAGDNGTEDVWYKLEFKPAAARPADSGLFTVASGSLSRAEPGKTIVIRAQVTPGGLDAVTEETAGAAEATIKGLVVQLLFREQEGEDKAMNMNPDPSGGLGGYGATLEGQSNGTILYYQVIACTTDGAKCAVDTGGKKKWNPLVVSAVPTDAPAPLEVISKKAPGSAPE